MRTIRETKQYTFIKRITDRALQGKTFSRSDGEKILSLQKHQDIMLLLAHANLLREHFHGSCIDMCSIINARSGNCSEDCIFCAQSAHYTTGAKKFPLMKTKEILSAAHKAHSFGVHHFSIVTSGKGISRRTIFNSVCATVNELCAIEGLVPCASLGILSKDQFRALRNAGLRRYHHNLETAESYFPRICTTHLFEDRLTTIRLAREEGLEMCCGGILGLGESPLQRLELAFTLRDLNVDSVPLNFLNPVAGTPLAQNSLLSPLEILKNIALFRYIMPEKEIRICGGRETGLKTLQPFMYIAGADGVMAGNYLTTQGRDIRLDIQEITALGLINLKK